MVGFAHKVDQMKQTVDQDRTRRALSSYGLFVAARAFLPRENFKILAKDSFYQSVGQDDSLRS